MKKGVDEEDAVGSKGSDAIYPAHLELPVVQSLTVGMYEPEGLEFEYTVMKHWYYYQTAQSSEFGVWGWYGTSLK